MKKIVLYHGSDHAISEPIYGLGNKYNDYGLGFYCTVDLDMAKEWANKLVTSGVVNRYSFDDSELKVLDLTDKNKYSVLNWIAILLHFRNIGLANKERYKRRLEFLEKNFYIDVSNYDVVIGFRADDSYFKFPMLFLQNELSVETLNEIYNLGELGMQYALVSKLSFERIRFIASIEAEYEYHDFYVKSKNNADKKFEELSINDLNSSNAKIEELISNYDKR